MAAQPRSAETQQPTEEDTFSATREGDSSNSDDASSEVPETVYQFIHENGRTYHSHRPGTYNFPNDIYECRRLCLQDQIFNFTFGDRRHFAPLDATKPLEVIDLGTGTGEWVCQMGDDYPNFRIQGTDLSPIQPNEVPPNVQFFIDDSSEHDWGFKRNRFDYIHTRAMLGSFTSFADVIKRAFHYTKPGAYTESQEISFLPRCDDQSIPPNWPFLEWTYFSMEASIRNKRPLDVAHLLKGWYQDAGFVDVQERIFKIPLNGWAKDRTTKELGELSERNWREGLSGFTMGNFNRVLGWEKDAIEVYLVNVRKAISDKHVHVYHNVHVVWGRKPFPGERV